MLLKLLNVLEQRNTLKVSAVREQMYGYQGGKGGGGRNLETGINIYTLLILILCLDN